MNTICKMILVSLALAGSAFAAEVKTTGYAGKNKDGNVIPVAEQKSLNGDNSKLPTAAPQYEQWQQDRSKGVILRAGPEQVNKDAPVRVDTDEAAPFCGDDSAVITTAAHSDAGMTEIVAKPKDFAITKVEGNTLSIEFQKCSAQKCTRTATHKMQLSTTDRASMRQFPPLETVMAMASATADIHYCKGESGQKDFFAQGECDRPRSKFLMPGSDNVLGMANYRTLMAYFSNKSERLQALYSNYNALYNVENTLVEKQPGSQPHVFANEFHDLLAKADFNHFSGYASQQGFRDVKRKLHDSKLCQTWRAQKIQTATPRATVPNQKGR